MLGVGSDFRVGARDRRRSPRFHNRDGPADDSTARLRDHAESQGRATPQRRLRTQRLGAGSASVVESIFERSASLDAAAFVEMIGADEITRRHSAVEAHLTILLVML